MSKPTPGPWKAGKGGPNGCPTIGHDGLLIAMCAHSTHDPHHAETAVANARLIAAAPELLEALRGLLSYTRACEDLLNASEAGQCKIARAAIEKTTTTP